MRKSNRGPLAVKTEPSGPGATKGNGVRALARIPAFNQYRRHREEDPLAKASHWGNLRRQDLSSLEVRVGRTAVTDGIVARNGYGDVLPEEGMATIAFLFCEK